MRHLRLPSSIISKRLISRVVISAFVVIVVSSMVTGLITWTNEKQALERRFREIQESYLGAIRAALWVNDREHLRLILMGISRLPGIAYARVYSEDEMKDGTDSRETDHDLKMVIPIWHRYNNQNYKIGELCLGGNPNYIFKMVVKDALAIALSQCVMILIICIVILIIINRSVIRRLLTVTDYTSTLSTDSLDNPLILDHKTKHPDELTTLAETINRMREALHGAFKQQKTLEDRLKKHTENLETAVAERTASLHEKNEQLTSEMEERKRIEEERENLIRELKDALSEVKKLSGLLPICANCKKIRDDKGYWNHVESYIKAHSEAEFSHGICPECAKKLYPELSLYEDQE
ncbi:MAG: HAMP domain-containing protein [Deltaproteobacteria bacterium]